MNKSAQKILQPHHFNSKDVNNILGCEYPVTAGNVATGRFRNLKHSGKRRRHGRVSLYENTHRFRPFFLRAFSLAPYRKPFRSCLEIEEMPEKSRKVKRNKAIPAKKHR